jgi:glycosyltransferase involved in cell wall biosynthesis
MNTTPKISVLMPVYNCELYVASAVESILNQTYTDFEFLIIDDASTDATLSIIKSYTDSRIKIIEKPINSGYTNSLNYGLTIAKGKYIARMDGDDISYPERFDKQIAYLEANPEVVVCGTNQKIVGNDKLIFLPQSNKSIKIRLLWGNCIPHSSAMIRKKILEDNNIQYDITTEPAEDYHLWIHLLAFGKLCNLPEVLLEYRVYSNQVSRKRAEEQKKSDIAAKFRMFHYLLITWNPVEREFLERQFGKTEIVSFKDIRVLKEIQKKLASANASLGFFESLLFKQYLTDLEADVLRKCFLKQKRYSPSMYLEYLIAKYQSKVKLTAKKELKLFFKSLIYWKTHR